MRDFNEFVASIKEDTVIELMQDANLKAEQIRSGMNRNDPAYHGNQIGAVSFTIALELLALYHKWIEGTDMN